MTNSLKRLDRALNTATIRAAMALMAVMCLVSLYQVLTRFVFGQPAGWSEVFARSLGIWMVYLGAAVCARHGTLICVEFLRSRLEGRAKAVLILLIAGVSLSVFAVVAWFGIEMTLRVRFQTLAGVENPFTGEGISIALVYAAVPVGAVLAMFAVFARLAEDLFEARGNQAGGARPTEMLEV